MTPTKQEAERADFERRARYICLNIDRNYDTPDYYSHGPTQLAWEFWKARAVQDDDTEHLINMATANQCYPMPMSPHPSSAVFRERVIQFGHDVLAFARNKLPTTQKEKS